MQFFDKASIDKIRGQALLAEQSGEMPKEWLNILYKKNYFKLFIPKQDNGLMMPLPQALRLFDEAGYIDGNLGWAITIGSGGGFFYAYMQPEIASKVFKGKKSLIAGSGAPTGTAKKVKGGYKVTGSWRYCSGAPFATSFTANVIINDKTKEIRAFIFEPKQVKIQKDWNAFGMKATESHSIVVKDAFVPEAMTFDLSITDLFYNHINYQYPFLQFAELSFASLTLGLCRHFMEEANNMLKENKKTWSLAEGRMEFVKNIIKEKENNFTKASTDFYKLADASWKEMEKNGKLSAKTQNQVSITSKKTSRIVLDCVDTVIQYMGMNAMMENSTINRVWRDTHTCCQHILLVPFAKV
jgi:alkylation response protein AidB-like acyl-CoA dehydrogenase